MALFLAVVGALMVGISAAPSHLFPAGVSPVACPNYPICDPYVDPTSGHVNAVAPAPVIPATPVAAVQDVPESAPAANGLVPPSSNADSYFDLPTDRTVFDYDGPDATTLETPEAPVAAPPAQVPPPIPQPVHVPVPPVVNPHFNGIPVRPNFAPVPVNTFGQAYFPAGVSPAECPNFPYCHDGNGVGNFAAGTSQSKIVGIPTYDPSKYPADFNPALCPNYPFCA